MLRWTQDSLLDLQCTQIGEHYGRYRLHVPEAERAMAKDKEIGEHRCLCLPAAQAAFMFLHHRGEHHGNQRGNANRGSEDNRGTHWIAFVRQSRRATSATGASWNAAVANSPVDMNIATRRARRPNDYRDVRLSSSSQHQRQVTLHSLPREAGIPIPSAKGPASVVPASQPMK